MAFFRSYFQFEGMGIENITAEIPTASKPAWSTKSRTTSTTEKRAKKTGRQSATCKDPFQWLRTLQEELRVQP